MMLIWQKAVLKATEHKCLLNGIDNLKTNLDKSHKTFNFKDDLNYFNK